MKEDIAKIIEDGIKAPSGENCQPWKFEVRDNRIFIYNIPEADQSIYNYGQKGSYVAHGALIENIRISALHHGYSPDINIFPGEKDLVATIDLSKTAPGHEDLYEAINERCTNRKDHNAQKLSADQKTDLVNAAKSGGLAELRIIDDPEHMRGLGEAVAVNELLLFENKKVHDFFYTHLFWKEEEQEKAGGFFIKTLEFLPNQLKAVKLFKNWFILSILNKLGGVSKKISEENARKYAKSGAIAVVIAQGSGDKDFVNAGRAMERVWLTATKLGLSVQPCTGLLYFMECIKAGGADNFSEEHRQIVEREYKNIQKIFNVRGETIPMLFRIGFGEKPTARAQRMSASIKYA